MHVISTSQAQAVRHQNGAAPFSAFWIHYVVCVVTGTFITSCVCFFQIHQNGVHVAELTQQARVMAPINLEKIVQPMKDAVSSQQASIDELASQIERISAAYQTRLVEEAASIDQADIYTSSGVPQHARRQEDKAPVSSPLSNLEISGRTANQSHKRAPAPQIQKEASVMHQTKRLLLETGVFQVGHEKASHSLGMHYSVSMIAFVACFVVFVGIAALCLSQGHNHHQMDAKKWILQIVHDAMESKAGFFQAKLQEGLGCFEDTGLRNIDKISFLQQVAKKGNNDVVEALRRCDGVDVAAKDGNGATVLHWAANAGCMDAIEALLRHDSVDVAAKDNDSATALHWAAKAGRMDVVEALLGHDTADVAAMDDNGATALHWAANAGHMDVVKALLVHDYFDVLVGAKDKNGATALHWAANAGRIDVVQALLGHDGLHANKKTKQGNSALHLAARAGHVGVVKALLGCSGVDVNQKTRDGDTALHVAANIGCADIVEALLRHGGLDTNDRTTQGNTALHLAAKAGHVDVAKALLRHDGVDINAKRNDGMTALFHAVSLENVHIVKALLLGVAGVDINAKSPDGWTVLHQAVVFGKLDVVIALLRCSGLDINAQKNDGRTALDIAIGQNHKGMVKILAVAGAKRGKRL
ncbi:Ankyrin repeat domain-containing protein [Seminavis robusta]|uniref:Ankyrin repeat domain-containing protein n=1 Tax=Seminavis robusta TaxID=568900 RepID=A0A9N8ECZ6_9STRA|nr:Ankyrin repeat domain-containing protein [Seminavis robusta]|eukprot:Sro968_g225960.1 Ankyrin repeat domain-containing protein (644) ;mRNA; r:9113-11044